MQDLRKKIKAKKLLQNWIWDDLGLNLGGLCDDLERLLAPFGRLLVVTWPSKIEFFRSIGPRLFSRGLWDRFGIDFGRIWGGF